MGFIALVCVGEHRGGTGKGPYLQPDLALFTLPFGVWGLERSNLSAMTWTSGSLEFTGQVGGFPGTGPLCYPWSWAQSTGEHLRASGWTGDTRSAEI